MKGIGKLLVVAAVVFAGYKLSGRFMPSRAGTDVSSPDGYAREHLGARLRLDFGNRGAIVDDAHDSSAGQVYLRGHLKNKGDQRIESVEILVTYQIATSGWGEEDVQEETFFLGPIEPGETVEYDDPFFQVWWPEPDEESGGRINVDWDIEILDVVLG